MELISRISIGTMGMLRLPSPFSFASVSLVFDTTFDTALFLAPWMKAILSIRDGIVLVRSILEFTVVRVGAIGSPVFPCNHFDFDVPSNPGWTATTRLYHSFGIAPTGRNIKASAFSTFEAKRYTFINRCLRFMHPSQDTMQNSLPVADYSLPDRLVYLHGYFEVFHSIIIRLI